VADVVPGHVGFIKDWEHYGSPFTPITPIVPVKQLTPSIPVESEKFNYCIGHYREGSDGAIESFAVINVTKEVANKFLGYVKKQSPEHDYKIFRVVEET
jgi:hypothetical protein